MQITLQKNARHRLVTKKNVAVISTANSTAPSGAPNVAVTPAPTAQANSRDRSVALKPKDSKSDVRVTRRCATHAHRCTNTPCLPIGKPAYNPHTRPSAFEKNVRHDRNSGIS